MGNGMLKLPGQTEAVQQQITAVLMEEVHETSICFHC